MGTPQRMTKLLPLSLLCPSILSISRGGAGAPWDSCGAWGTSCLVGQAAVHALLAWVSVSQIYTCMAQLAVAGGADLPGSQAE